MNKQKIKVLYELSDEALKRYFIEGNKQEKNQEIWIETDNESIVNKTSLIDNEYLLLDLRKCDMCKKIILCYKNGAYDYKEKDFLEHSEKENFIRAEIRNSNAYRDQYFPSSNILTQEEIIDILDPENTKEYKELVKRCELYSNEFEKNKQRIEKEDNEKREKIDKEYKDKEIKKENDKKEMDAFIEKSGSETLKLRKELGYDYKDLAINEFLDTIESKEYDRVEWGKIKYNDITITKPSLDIMKTIKEMKQREFVVDVFAEKWTEYEEDSMEVLCVKYLVWDEEKTRFYRIS